MLRLFYKIITIAVIAVLIVPAGIIPVARAELGADVLGVSGGVQSVGGGGTPNVGAVSGGSGAPDAVYVAGMNPAIIASLRAPNVSTAISTAAETRQSLFEWAQEFVLEKLKKKILDMIVDDIVRWVQGGGNPKFVTDWGKFFEDAGNVALRDLATRVGGAGLCEPFKQNILNSLLVRPPERFSNSSYGSSITCTLDDIVGNVESFYADFDNGGWAAYNASWQVENNPISVLIITESAKYQTIAAAQKNAEIEALTGRGFLSAKICFEDPKSTGPDLDGDKVKGDVASTCRITTPGSTIGDLVGKAVGSDIDYIVNAQQLAAYVSAITDALWNRLIHETGGLANTSTSNAPGGSTLDPSDDFIPEGAESCQALGSPDLIEACEDYIQSNGGNFGATRDGLLTDIQHIKSELEALRPELVEWKQVADELNEFIIAESQDRPAACIAEALEPHFSNNTPAGVAAYAASVNVQLTTLDARIVKLEEYRLELRAIPADDPNAWANFTLSASNIQGQLRTMQVAEDAAERAIAEREEARIAFTVDIRPDVLMCN